MLRQGSGVQSLSKRFVPNHQRGSMVGDHGFERVRDGRFAAVQHSYESSPIRESLSHGFGTNWQMTKTCTRGGKFERLIRDIQFTRQQCNARQSLLHYLIQLRRGTWGVVGIPKVFGRDRVRTYGELFPRYLGHAAT